MKHRYDGCLDPQPFRDWCLERIDEGKPSEEIGGYAAHSSSDDLATKLGLDPRRLYAWRFENKMLDRLDLEDALIRAGYGIWDVYDESELGALPEPDERNRGGVPIGTGSKLSDDMVRVLHRMHVERRASIRKLADEIWQQVGYASSDSAWWSIRRGFERLHLPVVYHGPNALGARRCTESNSAGKPCGGTPLIGSKVCWSHHPDHREEARERARRVSPFAKAAA